MLKRKSEEEIAEIQRQHRYESRSFRFPLLIGIGCGVILGPALYLTGGRYAKPFEITLDRVFEFSIISIISIPVFLYIIQRIQGRSISREHVGSVCPKCLKMDVNFKKYCECGEKLEPREYYNYK